jgi:hypothetical protein
MNIFRNINGRVEWDHKEGDVYIATGITVDGKKFKMESKSWWYINGINLYRGTKWLKRDGKKYKIQAVYN